MQIAALYEKFLDSSGISTDTRKIEEGKIFFALKGENFNGNLFAQEALNKGAKFIVADEKHFADDANILILYDVLTTLQQLASHHRRALNLKVIAIGGSNGKTTTKELISQVLGSAYKTFATKGNLNNHIGIPLTILSVKKDAEIAVIEMGANHQKEIELLCSIAQPDFGYITNFGKAHLEGFGGIKGVIKGKSEMYMYLQNKDKLAFINLDDPIQKEKAENLKNYTFSTTQEADVTINNVEANPMVEIEYKGHEIKSHLIGIYNANNISAAITIGNYFEVSDEAIKEAIENYIPENNRSQLLHKNGNELILDAYNANPSSMQAAIANFTQLEGDNKIAILGDMFELGTESLEEHKRIVALLAKETKIRTYFIGKHFYAAKITSNIISFFEDFNAFSSYFKNNIPANSQILIKGSRGMALEKTLEII